MALPQGLEPWTLSFVDSRSNPTELQEHLVLQERFELPTPALEERCSFPTELLEYKKQREELRMVHPPLPKGTIQSLLNINDYLLCLFSIPH